MERLLNKRKSTMCDVIKTTSIIMIMSTLVEESRDLYLFGKTGSYLTKDLTNLPSFAICRKKIVIKICCFIRHLLSKVTSLLSTYEINCCIVLLDYLLPKRVHTYVAKTQPVDTLNLFEEISCYIQLP